MLTGDHG